MPNSQFTLMIALELHDESERDCVKSRLTVIYMPDI
tara:strand:- start:2317 stop:2424 length:108 start_codon:yes stop_codon:yes gene_type:complete